MMQLKFRQKLPLEPLMNSQQVDFVAMRSGEGGEKWLQNIVIQNHIPSRRRGQRYFKHSVFGPKDLTIEALLLRLHPRLTFVLYGLLVVAWALPVEPALRIYLLLKPKVPRPKQQTRDHNCKCTVV